MITRAIEVRVSYFFLLFLFHSNTRIFAEMVATEEQLQRAKIPVAYRDYCSHLLIALNDCRLKEYWMPWKCEHERHSYEMCEYEEYVKFFLYHTCLRKFYFTVSFRMLSSFLFLSSLQTRGTRSLKTCILQMEKKKTSKEGCAEEISKIHTYINNN